MTDVTGYTVVAYKEIVSATVAAETFLMHNPNSRFVVAVLDYPSKIPLLPNTAIEYLSVTRMPDPIVDFSRIAVSLNREQLSRFVRAKLARLLALETDVLVYVDHQVQVFGPCDDLIELSTQHDLVVVPRRFTPLSRDDLEPTTKVIWQDFYDSGIIGFNADRTEFVDWWVNRVELSENEDHGSEYAFLNEAVSLFDAEVLREGSYGVSFWNLDERILVEQGGDWWTNDTPLKSFYFKGFSIQEPFWLSDLIGDKPRFLLSELGQTRSLYLNYATKLRGKHAELMGDDLPKRYGWNDALPGIPLTPGMRHVYRNEWLLSDLDSSLPSPFTARGLRQFITWWGGKTKLDGPSVQRFVLALFIDRPDIHAAYVHGNSIDYDGLQQWMKSFGRAEYPLIRLMAFDLPEKSQIEDLGRSKMGVDVIGSFTSEHGLGEAGRLLVNALRTTEETISTISYSPVGVRGKHPFVSDQRSCNRLTIVALNPEQTRDLWRISGPNFRRDRYVIGQWFWELEIPPPWYKAAYSEQLIDELWAPTKFIEKMLLDSVPSHVSVRHMPLPFVKPGVDESFTLEQLGLPPKYTFLFTFDFGSVVKRKNPEGVIEAFKHAFLVDDGAQLIIKSINGQRRLKQYERLRLLCDGRPDIHLIDEYFDNDMNAALIAMCDCYVSLHRSEGLGLTLAEAMLFEKPVIATGYSGNLDFMTEDTGFLVPWKYSTVGEDADAYPSYAKWAEPDVEAAAILMRELFLNPDRGQELGRFAREYIETEFSPSVTGARMASRLRELRK